MRLQGDQDLSDGGGNPITRLLDQRMPTEFRLVASSETDSQWKRELIRPSLVISAVFDLTAIPPTVFRNVSSIESYILLAFDLPVGPFLL